MFPGSVHHNTSSEGGELLSPRLLIGRSDSTLVSDWSDGVKVVGLSWDLRREMQFPGVELEHCPADATQRESNTGLSLDRPGLTWSNTDL